MPKLSVQLESLISEMEKKGDFSEDALKEIMSWQNDAIKIDELEKLKDSEGLRILVKDFEDSVKVINNAFIGDEGRYLNDAGKVLLERRSWFQEFLNVFNFADDQKKNLEKKIREEQENIK